MNRPAPLFTALLAAIAPGAAAAPLRMDTIRKLDGSALENVQVSSDGLKEVVFKDAAGKSATLPSEQVSSIAYERQPKAIDDAEGLIGEEDLSGAVAVLDAYVDAQIAKPSERQFRWGPAQAAWRACEVRLQAGDLAGLPAAAQRLIASFPDSRHVPRAYLLKAGAEQRSGQAEQAKQTLAELSTLVTDQALAKRWALACRLAQIQVDPGLDHAARRNELERLAGEAKGEPVVALRARVAAGESLLAGASFDQGNARELVNQAKQVFQQAISEQDADRETLAAAYTGLGDCLFLTGAEADDKAILLDAALQYLRVITVYREQGFHVPKALFYAMRCFDLMQDNRRKADMRRELASLFPDSTWAAEAKKY
jgi:hypothetical protein